MDNAERRRRTREALLEAAAQEFEAYGYEKTTLQGVADRLGLTRGTVLFHFHTKEASIPSLHGVMSACARPWRAATAGAGAYTCSRKSPTCTMRTREYVPDCCCTMKRHDGELKAAWNGRSLSKSA